MITEDYVSFETAKLLKEKGFDEKCYVNYNFNGETQHFNYHTPSDGVACPTLQMAMKWLREVHHCHIIINYTFKADANLSEDYIAYCYSVENANIYIQYTHNEWYDIYEQACKAAIKYCLENLI